MSDRDTIAAAINTKFATPCVKTLAESQTASSDHVVLFVSRRYVADRLTSGEVTIPGGRVVSRYVCLRETNVDVYRARVRAALEDQILTGDLGPFTFETEDAAELDDSNGSTWFVSSDSWTY